MSQKQEDDFRAAARRGDVTAVAGALAAGVKVDCADSFGNTALMMATGAGQGAMVEFLLSKKADANIADEDGILPLTMALKDKAWEMAGLLAGRTDLSLGHGDKHITALHSAYWLDLRDKDTARTHFLLQRFANPNIPDSLGKSVKFHATDGVERWPFAQTLRDVIEEYRDGPVVRQQRIDDKRRREIRAAMADFGDQVAPPRAVFKRKGAPQP